MEKKKKPFYKRWWFIAIIIIGVIGSIGGGEDTPKEPTKQVATNEDNKVIETKSVIEKTEEPKEVEKPEDNVSREYRNALKAAQNYIDIMPFSEQGLLDQLTSEYGDQYPVEAAQYAIENVKVDYNKEALEAAKNYQEIMPMSDQELFDQLRSEYGDQFTKEQAQYAIDNLPE